MPQKSILDIARAARKQSEIIRGRWTFPKSMCGMCSRSAAILFKMLVAEGYDPKICLNEDWPHTFIMIDNDVIDLTATQFSVTRYKAVFLQSKENIDNTRPTGHPYRVTHEFITVESLIEYLKKVKRVEYERPDPTDMLSTKEWIEFVELHRHNIKLEVCDDPQP